MPNYWEQLYNEYSNQSNGDAMGEHDGGTAVMAPPEFEPSSESKGSHFASLQSGPKSLRKCLYFEGMNLEEIEKELSEIDKYLAANPESDKKELLEESKKRLEKEIEYYDTYDDITDKPHNQAHLMGDQGEMTRLMLKTIGYEDPKKYYREMVSINLFGQQAKGIRKEFAEQLKLAEKKTLEKLGAEDPKLKDPRNAARYLGINDRYRTSRIFRSEKPEYQSMHLFGLAIDINFVNNPWVTMEGVDRAATKKNKANFRNLVKDIDALFGTHKNDKYKYVDANSKVESDEDFEAIYDGYHGVDKQIEAYCELENDEKKLKALWKDNENEPWASLTFEEAKKKVYVDIEFMIGRSGRYQNFNNKYKGNTVEVDGRKTMRAEGIMDMDKRMVTSMHEANLDWGGKYGDMMHFDMRFHGIGKKISRAKNNSKVKALKKKMRDARKKDKQ